MLTRKDDDTRVCAVETGVSTHLVTAGRPIQKSPSGVCVSPYWSLARREYPGIEGVPPSNEGKMPSIPALPARSSPPVPTFD